LADNDLVEGCGTYRAKLLKVVVEQMIKEMRLSKPPAVKANFGLEAGRILKSAISLLYDERLVVGAGVPGLW